MNLKPLNPGRQLPSFDEKSLEKLLNEEYSTSVFTSMYYSYPMNDNRLLLEYAINFYDNGERTQFFRKAFKKNGEWRLCDEFRIVKYVLSGTDTDAEDIEQLIRNYMGE